jgi:Outer membrane protein beta-barrel domain
METAMRLFKRYCLAAVALTLLAGNAFAANANTDKGNWYVGGGVGVAEVKDLCSHTTFSDCDDNGGAFRVFGGLQVNPYFALEASIDMNGDYQTPGARAAGYDGSTGAFLFGLNAIGFLPVSNRVSLYGGASGVFSYVATDVTETRYHNRNYSTCYYDNYDSYYGWYSYCTNDDNDKDYRSDTSVAAGALVGVDVKVADRVHVRAQAQRFFNVKSDLGFGGRDDIDQFTINGLFMF